MKEVQVNARTVEEAKKAARERLGVEEDEVEYIVLSEGRSGILGIGAQDAVVKASLRVDRVAYNVLAGLVHRLDPQAKVMLVGEEEGRFVFSIAGEDVGILIGRRGKTLEALQYIAGLMVSGRAGEPVMLSLDINDYEKKHFEAVKMMAQEMARKVKTTRRAITLRPMPAKERRLVHLALSGSADITTYSTGSGDDRRVVISPKHTDEADRRFRERSDV